MTRRIVIINEGERYGHLTVIEAYSGKNKLGKWLNWCQCDCGNFKLIESVQLKRGISVTCGCHLGRKGGTNIKNRKYTGDQSLQSLSFDSILNRYKQKSKIRGLSWDLSDDYALELLKQNCTFCNSPPNNLHNVYIAKTGTYRVNNKEYAETGWILFNGIDRLNNKEGYNVENCVTCCKFCNYAKHSVPLADFLLWLSRVRNNG